MSKQCRSRLAHQARSFQVTLCSFILAGILVFSLIFVASPAQALADEELTPLVYTTQIDNLGQLVKTLIDLQITDNVIEIYITRSFDIDRTVRIPTGRNVKLTSATGIYTLQRAAGFTDSLFSVENGSSLTIENIRLDGMGNTSPTVEASAPLITVAAGCTLNLNAGAQLEQNNNTNTTQAESGGAVNNAGTTTLAGATIVSNIASYGGGIYNSGTLILCDDTVITDNIALVYGGGVYNTGIVTIESTVPANSCEITANKAMEAGGGIGNDQGGVLTMSEGRITYNLAPFGAGVINLGTFRYSGGSISYNDTTSGGNYGSPTSGEGGGVLNYATSSSIYGVFEITDSTAWITNNKAVYGGGISNRGELLMDDGFISENTAEDGAGIHSLHSYSTTTIRDGVISGNNASGHGGGIALIEGSLTIEDITLANNQAQYGGGLSILNENRDDTYTTMSGGIIMDNTAQYGGGVAIYRAGSGQLNRTVANLTMTGGQINNNIAAVDGGGLWSGPDSSAVLSDVSLTSNTASGLGAEVYDDGAITVSGTIKIGLRNSNSGVYLLPARTLSVAAAGLAQDALIFIEALDSSETEAGRVVATRADGSAATTAEARLFAYLPDTSNVVALGGTSNYILAASELRVTPASLTFDKTVVGSKSATLAVTVTGTALDPIVLSAPAGFLIQEGSDWDTLLGGTVYVTFAPTQAGDITGVLTIASGSNTQSVNLSGTAFEGSVNPEETTVKGSALPQAGDSLTPLLMAVGGFIFLATHVLLFTRRALSRG